MKNQLDKDLIKYISGLAKLNLTDQETEKYLNEFKDILGYISQIQECDTSEIDSGNESSKIDITHNLLEYKGEPLQDDTVKTFPSPHKLLQNATNRKRDSYIKTSKIVDKSTSA